MTFLILVLFALAAYRVVRLWQHDTITKPLREAVYNRLLGLGPGRTPVFSGEGRLGKFRIWLHDLLSCQWCLGVWVSFGLVGLTWLFVDYFQWMNAWTYLVISLSVSAAQSFVAMFEDVLERWSS